MRKLLILIVAISLVIVAAFTYWNYRELNRPLPIMQEKMFNVNPGQNISGILENLKKYGFITHTLPAKIWLKFHSDFKTIKVGSYLFPAKINTLELLNILSEGKVVTYKISLIEGKTFKDFRMALSKAENLKQDTKDLTDSEIMAKLGSEGVHPEGQFFPDTYVYYPGNSDWVILRLAHNKLKEELEKSWQSRAAGLPYKTSYQALIMASIVEKETGAAFERNKIAGVFVRRLQKGIRLQTDPSVIYGMGEDFVGNITKADLQKYTPYNTYRKYGLPPTPIANVGKAAIEAAMHPEAGSELYFVAKGDGTHKFSSTLKEHNQAVRQYQKKRRSDYRSTPE